MIRNWKITNFKSVADGCGLLELGPITLLAGANSSGKSTIIQSILLLMQSMVERRQGVLQLNGDLISLGTVMELWHNGQAGEDAVIQYQVCINDPSDSSQEFLLELTFIPDTDTRARLVNVAIHVRRLDRREIATLSASTEAGNWAVDRVSDEIEAEIRNILSREKYEGVGPLNDAPMTLNGLLPNAITVQATRREVVQDWPAALANPLHEELTDAGLQTAIPDDYLPHILEIGQRLSITALFHLDQHNQPILDVSSLRDLRTRLASLPKPQFDEWRSEVENALDTSTLITQAERIKLREIPQFSSFERTFADLFTRHVRYLGAFRTAPSVAYRAGTSSHWSEVGVDGSNIASALNDHGQRTVTWFDPLELRRRDTTLLEAAAQWLQYLGVLDEVATEDRGKLGTLLTVRSAGVEHDLDLTSVGFGVSQVLPIIVQGLLTPRNGVFIVEQPEVHLHPAVQSKLAIFFLALSRNGVQCIVETHSENLVNQFQLLAIDKRSNLASEIKIYFAERDLDFGTQIFAVELDWRGNIRNWPAGFMDETTKQSSSILRAMLAADEDEE